MTTTPATTTAPAAARPTVVQHLARILLGLALTAAGVGHLTVLRAEFQAQVPPWLPLPVDLVVVGSGVVEILLGLGLILLWRARWPMAVGWAAALFFLAIFPGNIAQFTEGRDGFGLDDDVARGIRLLFQPVLVAWALWSTGAWQAWRAHRAARSAR
ncbi:DoxX family protein [Microcella flavibacter]|uniref:DoxX family protein n=1 Tax=Microcella flavibacter TaxID=1804990 RepID=UPI001456CE1E|nr:hypothetical protein [Microcella flavibacter]